MGLAGPLGPRSSAVLWEGLNAVTGETCLAFSDGPEKKDDFELRPR